MKIWIAYIVTVLVIGMALVILGARQLESVMARAVAQAQAERNAHWKAEIAESNAQTERTLRLQTMAAQAADTAARSQIAAANMKILELDKANETLQASPCGGLGRDRVKLLQLGPR